VAWLISETQDEKPEEDAAGWGSEPVTFMLSAPDGQKTVYIWVKDGAGNINTGPVSDTITLDTIAPADPTLELSDQTSGSSMFTNSQIVNVVVGNDGEAVAWLISETQDEKPEEDAAGWGSEPVTFMLSAPDGQKTVYIWVKDGAGNINTGPVFDTITLDTGIANPTLELSDQTSGSSMFTNSQIVDVTVGNDTGVSKWLISETQDEKPEEDAAGWVNIRPVTFMLSAPDGPKTVYIWVKDGAGNINTRPVSDTITLDMRIPNDPTLELRDRTTGSTEDTDERLVNVQVGNEDTDVVAWLISETQDEKPEEDAAGWGSEPVTFMLSAPDGQKTVYIWVKDGAGNINTGPVSDTILLDASPLAAYRITSSVASATTRDSFSLTIELINPLTGMRKIRANNPFILTACTVGGTDAPGKWIKTEGALVLTSGWAEVRVSCNTVGTIRFKVTDDFGRPPAYSDPIDILPWGLRYELNAPERAEAGEEFSLIVRLIDTGAGNTVTPPEYCRQVRLAAYSSPDGSPAEGELKVKSFYLQGGETVLSQSYNIAHTIYIEASDGKQYAPQSIMGRTADIEVIGAPKTVLKLDGAYNEINAALYVTPNTRVIIESVSDIVAEKILYRDKDSEWKTYVEPFTLSPGRHVIEYYGIDKYGHKEGINQSKPIYVSFFGAGDGVTNRPNPFKAGREPTLIEYNLKEPSNVIITIYDLFGQEVWHERYAAGEKGGAKDINSVPWDGRNLSGKVVANGGYICRVWIEREKRHMTRKIAVAK